MINPRPRKKLAKLNFYNNLSLKLWLIPEIYGWLIVAIGFGIFVMLLVAAFAHLMDVGLSFDSLYSLLQLAEGITIGGGLIAFGTALRRFVVVQVTLCIILLLAGIWFLYFFWVTGFGEDGIKYFFIALGVAFPLALCVFVNRERLKTKHEPAQSEIDTNFYELQTNMSPEIFAEIEKLCQRGDIFFTGAKYIRAIEQYRAALKLVPEPVEEHDAATWIYAAIGDSYFSSGSYQESAQTFLKSLSSPKALHNPFINLRLGQSFFEIGERNKAAGFLAQAYMSEGREIFEGEEPHYFEFLKTQIRPPEDGKW